MSGRTRIIQNLELEKRLLNKTGICIGKRFFQLLFNISLVYYRGDQFDALGVVLKFVCYASFFGDRVCSSGHCCHFPRCLYASCTYCGFVNI